MKAFHTKNKKAQNTKKIIITTTKLSAIKIYSNKQQQINYSSEKRKN